MKTIAIWVSLWAGVLGFSRLAAADFPSWREELRQALVSGRGMNLERFFTPAAHRREVESWKYNLENGFLDFPGTEIVALSDRAILLHIPTRNHPYSGEDEDSYFDFIYRIYEIEPQDGSFVIARRAKGEFNPDFIRVRSRIEIRPREQAFLLESVVSADLPGDHLIFKLAKEFAIEEFRINGKKAPYRRLGYFIYAGTDRGGRIEFSLKGKLPAPKDNNQFFSMDRNCFFLRMGGFAALPSPPPGENGRYVFSEDQTRFELTYVFPKEFKFLQYGKVCRERISGDKKILSVVSESDWMDGIAFYAQRDWDPQSFRAGNARLSFYSTEKDRAVLEPLIEAIRELFDWSFSVFHAYPESEFNFVVLDRFVENGALNDGRSIVTRDAQTQVDDTYIHELLHTVPQPRLRENYYLWLKEGFTNFLSFNFLEDRDGKKEFWKRQQRRYLHYFDQFDEPLAALTSTRMPTYWAAYEKGPWVFRMLSAAIGAPDFRNAMLALGKMKGQVLAGPRDYFGIFEKISGQDLAWFEDQWLNRKDNPVLRVESSIEPVRDGVRLKLKIRQEGTIFRLPLELEIDAGSRRIRETVWVDAAEKEVSFPLEQPPVSVRFDPDAKLFAIVKTGTISFLNPDEIVLPRKPAVYRFRSEQTGQEVEFRIIPEPEKVTFIRKEEGRESVLELSPALSPLKYSVNGAPVYSMDQAIGKIVFPDAARDVAEPVYPEDFCGLLFSCADWSKKAAAHSLLFLRSQRNRCAAAYAESEGIAGCEVKVNVDMYAASLTMTIRAGVPLEYAVDGKERFVLLDTGSALR